MDTITLDAIYSELKCIRKKLDVVECAIIPTKKLSAAELSAHKKDLADAMNGKTAWRAAF